MSDQDETEIVRPCSAVVEYKDRPSGGCQRESKYPDADGVRWWCGLHNPDRPKARLASAQAESHQIDREVLLGMAPQKYRDEMLETLEDVHRVLIELSNMRDSGWPPTTPVEKYKIIMAHMADRAMEVSRTIAEKISRFKS